MKRKKLMRRIVKLIKSNKLKRIQMGYEKNWGGESSHGLLIGINSFSFILVDNCINAYMNVNSIAKASFKFLNDKHETELEIVTYKDRISDMHEIMGSLFGVLENSSTSLDRWGKYIDEPPNAKGYQKIVIGSSVGASTHKSNTTTHSYVSKKKQIYFICSENFSSI